MKVIRKTIDQIITDVVKIRSGRDALVHTEIGVRYNYDDLSRHIGWVAGGFLRQGIRPGDKVALWSPNHPEWILAMLALAKIGVLTVPVDSLRKNHDDRRDRPQRHLDAETSFCHRRRIWSRPGWLERIDNCRPSGGSDRTCQVCRGG